MEAELAKVRERRAEIEERVASGEDERRAQAQRLAEARGAVERLRARIESVESAERELRGGLGERQLRLTELDDEPEAVTASAARIAELEAELETLKTAAGEPDAELEQLRAQAVAAAQARAEAQEELAPLVEAAQAGAEKLERATRAREMARAESEKVAQRLASLQGELAAVEAKLARAAMEGDDEVLAGLIETGPGIERALSAALGEHLRAIVVGSVAEGVERIGCGRGRLAGPGHAAARAPSRVRRWRARAACSTWSRPRARPARSRADCSPMPGSWTPSPSCPMTSPGSPSRSTARPTTARSASCASVPREGTDPALAARSQREELVSRARAAGADRGARAGRPRPGRGRADRGAGRARRDGPRPARNAARARRGDRGGTPGELARGQARRARAGSDDAAPRPARCRAGRRAPPRAGRRAAGGGPPRARASGCGAGSRLETETLPALASAREALARVLERVERRADAIGAPGAEHGGEVAQELRECSKLEFELGGRMREVSEALTTAEVGAAQLRDRRDESRAELERLAASLDRELGPAEAPLGEAEREEIGAKLERLTRRREQIGPVNPLAGREYEEASEHVRELTEQRKDLEQALTEIKALIRRTDREIEQAFEETFEATARNFEEMVAELFPGGKGRLRQDRGRPAEAAADDRRRRRERGCLRRGGRGGGRCPQGRGLRRRDRGRAGRQVHPPPLAPLRRREVAGRPGLRLRGPDGPPMPLLHPR